MADLTLSPGQQIKAILEIDEVQRLLKTRYGIDTHTIVELDAYDDRNYRIELPVGVKPDNPHVSEPAKHGYVLKIINSLDSKSVDFYEAQTELLVFLRAKGICCPEPVRQKDGTYFSMETLQSGEKHILRLLVFQPGETLGKVEVSADLFENLGRYAGLLNVIMQDFSHPGYKSRTSLWSLDSVPRIRDFLFAVEDEASREVVKSVVESFEKQVLSIYANLDRGIIHGDLNESNILVGGGDRKEISGVIDFGDSHENCYVFELAICLCYMITKVNDIEMGRHVIDGYKSVKPLSIKEREILKVCVCARFAQSLVLGAYSHSREPDNQYLARDVEVKWALLKKLWKMRNTKAMDAWGIKGRDDDFVQ